MFILVLVWKQVKLALGLPKNLAVSVGRRFTDATSARSFKVVPVGFTRQRDVGLIDVSKYRSPKLTGRVAREGFTLVEKAKFLIDTPGEFRGITLKGVSSRKRSRKLKRR